jgi:hypothetical protein
MRRLPASRSTAIRSGSPTGGRTSYHPSVSKATSRVVKGPQRIIGK